MEENPFDVESIDEFLFYCCPQCEIKCKDGKSFIEHATQTHEQAKEVPLYFEDEEMPMSENIESIGNVQLYFILLQFCTLDGVANLDQNICHRKVTPVYPLCDEL